MNVSSVSSPNPSSPTQGGDAKTQQSLKNGGASADATNAYQPPQPPPLPPGQGTRVDQLA
jgi:hypothetical protein